MQFDLKKRNSSEELRTLPVVYGTTKSGNLPDGNVQEPLDYDLIDGDLSSKKFPAMKFALDIINYYSLIIHNDVVQIYTDVKFINPDGEKFGGRYMPLNKLAVRRLIAEKIPVVVKSLGSKTVDAIAEIILLYAPKIDEDLSDRRELLIMNDGGCINAAGLSDEIIYIGSKNYFSRTLAISSEEYKVAKDIPESLVQLSILQVGEEAGGMWLNSLAECGGYLIAGEQERSFIVLQGNPASFKSHFVNMLASIWPPDGVDAQYLDKFNERFSLEKTKKSAFMCFSDAQSGIVKPNVVALVKSITGGDYVAINTHYKERFTTQLQQPIVIVTNNPFYLNDYAAESRAVVIPFYRSFTIEEGRKIREQMFLDRISIFKFCLKSHLRRKSERRQLISLVKLNSCIQNKINGERWEGYVNRYIINCLHASAGDSVKKEDIYCGFCTVVKPLLSDFNVDQLNFYRLFNEQFRLIYPNYKDALTEIRIGEWTGKGIKGFTLDITKHNNSIF